MNYIDLLIIHRWDYDTPIEETMKVLHDVIESGKVRYIGASAMFAHQFLKAKYEKNKDMAYAIVERVHETAEKYHVSMSQIALAWLLSKRMMASPVTGVTKMTHLEEACASINVKLADEDVSYLEELYQPHPVSGAR